MHPTPVESSQVKRVAVHMQCCVPNSNVKKLNKNDVCGRMGDIAHRIVTTHLIFLKYLVLFPPQVLHRVQLGRRHPNLLL